MRTCATIRRSPVRAWSTAGLPVLFGLLLASSLGATSAVAPASGTAEPASGISSDAALARLRGGNRRFRSGGSLHPNADAARLRETAEKGQAPFATILGCSDSRVPCELLFDQGVGDLFVVRVAGNVCGVDETASIEYGIGHLGTSLVVVLGHEKCGAVTAVATDAELDGSIPRLVEQIRPAVENAQRVHPGMKPNALVPFALRENVLQSIEGLFRRSGTARRLVREGKVAVVGAVYDIETGEVSWLGPHLRQAALVKEGGAEDSSGRSTSDAPAHAASR
jgi:carbonic anhydrase